MSSEVDTQRVPGYLAPLMREGCVDHENLAAFGPLFIALGDPPPEWTRDEIPFVPTPIEVVDRMFELAEVMKNDVLYDLGSGDGTIVIRAAKKYGARGDGCEVDVELVEASRKRAAEESVTHMVEIRAEEALTPTSRTLPSSSSTRFPGSTREPARCCTRS